MAMKRDEKTIMIYEAALRVFARFGYKKATVEDIGTELNMAKSNLYLYVKNKRELYENAVSHGLKKWQNHARTAAEKKDDIIEKIVEYSVSGYNYLENDPDLRAIITGDPTIFPLSPTEDRFHEINRESMDVLKSYLVQGIREKRFREIPVDTIVELLYSIYIMFIIKTYVKQDGDISRQKIMDGFDLVLKGLLR